VVRSSAACSVLSWVVVLSVRRSGGIWADPSLSLDARYLEAFQIFFNGMGRGGVCKGVGNNVVG
jgi:hypothetical protein